MRWAQQGQPRVPVLGDGDAAGRKEPSGASPNLSWNHTLGLGNQHLHTHPKPSIFSSRWFPFLVQGNVRSPPGGTGPPPLNHQSV